MPEGAARLVSLHDPDARPIRKRRIDRPVEFGYKAQVSDNNDGIILDYNVEPGAAADGPQLVPTIERSRWRLAATQPLTRQPAWPLMGQAGRIARRTAALGDVRTGMP